MALYVICSSCGQPVDVEYRYDRVILHQCFKCKAGITVVAPSPYPAATANEGALSAVTA